MNVYDFDQTIFYPDSSYCFCKYCFNKNPKLFFRVLPKMTLKGIESATHICNTKQLKEAIFSFLQWIPDVDKEIENFWDCHWGNIQSWYLDQKNKDDIIISASPDFLVRPAAERLGVSLIATEMDKKTGKILGENCHDKEKVKRFFKEFPNASVDEFYSDSLHDTPMAEISMKAFLVKKSERFPWPEKHM